MPRTPSRSDFETASATCTSVVERGQFNDDLLTLAFGVYKIKLIANSVTCPTCYARLCR